jgi:hypothetical protein
LVWMDLSNPRVDPSFYARYFTLHLLSRTKRSSEREIRLRVLGDE